jgi:hypothetical protein
LEANLFGTSQNDTRKAFKLAVDVAGMVATL